MSVKAPREGDCYPFKPNYVSPGEACCAPGTKGVTTKAAGELAPQTPIERPPEWNKRP